MKTVFEVGGLQVKSDVATASIEHAMVSVEGTASAETESKINDLLTTLTDATRNATQLLKLECEKRG